MELRVVAERLLEVRLGFVVVLAALPRQARVERRLGELALRGRGAVEHLRDLAARRLVPVACFVVGVERVESGLEFLLGVLVDGDAGGRRRASAATGRVVHLRAAVTAAACDERDCRANQEEMRSHFFAPLVVVVVGVVVVVAGVFCASTAAGAWYTPPPITRGGGRSSRPLFESVGAPRSSSTTWYSAL